MKVRPRSPYGIRQLPASSRRAVPPSVQAYSHCSPRTIEPVSAPLSRDGPGSPTNTVTSVFTSNNTQSGPLDHNKYVAFRGRPLCTMTLYELSGKHSDRTFQGSSLANSDILLINLKGFQLVLVFRNQSASF